MYTRSREKCGASNGHSPTTEKCPSSHQRIHRRAAKRQNFQPSDPAARPSTIRSEIPIPRRSSAPCSTPFERNSQPFPRCRCSTKPSKNCPARLSKDKREKRYSTFYWDADSLTCSPFRGPDQGRGARYGMGFITSYDILHSRAPSSRMWIMLLISTKRMMRTTGLRSLRPNRLLTGRTGRRWNEGSFSCSTKAFHIRDLTNAPISNDVAADYLRGPSRELRFARINTNPIFRDY
mmetsp:Transcript_8516/g.15409  ORF Transcript_8516/g.15409 Transcript_8516/m.15409 type:complete len:235 (+) Transcript_8516:155-859(+)